jgi:hypothetical protein
MMLELEHIKMSNLEKVITSKLKFDQFRKNWNLQT